MTTHDAIVKRVRAALDHERRIRPHRHPLKVALADGGVMIDGDVDNIGAKKLALGIAAAVARIGSVVDRIRIAVPQRRGDGAMRTTLAQFLLAEPELRTCTIRARIKRGVETLRDASGERSGDIEIGVDDGVIALDGAVISLSHKRFAGVIGWWTPGCRDVVNALDVVPGEDDNDAEVVEPLRIVLEADPMIESDQIAARCHDHVVTLGGFVRTKEQRRRAELDAWALFAVADVINRIAVGPAS